MLDPVSKTDHLKGKELVRRPRFSPRTPGRKRFLLLFELCPVRLSHQLSGNSCAWMSTRQIGHFLLVASHWSTQTWWNRCMHASRLTSSPSSNMQRQIVHFSSKSISSSSFLSSLSSSCILFLYLCGRVHFSIIYCMGPRLTVPSLTSNCNNSS